MYRIIIGNKYRQGNKFKSFEMYKWYKKRKEIDLNKIKCEFLNLLQTKKIKQEKLNYGIMKVDGDKNLLYTTKIKSQTFLKGD